MDAKLLEFLDIEFRSIISHRMLGYDCKIAKEDFDGMIEDCIKATEASELLKGLISFAENYPNTKAAIFANKAIKEITK